MMANTPRGAIIQKLVNYRSQLVIVGDTSRWVESSNALCDFVYESNKGCEVCFLPYMDGLAERLQPTVQSWI
ncbi:DUF4180 domain-containing protein [Rhizobium sp. SYY.PMSO]|uniref:DUF4180 domain-containing protein n=1 Tax=Rhizobium sp. SYY.PMSO TaxID=3382192 RepID=UPI00398FD86E